MEDQAPKENPPKDFNKIDLTQLQSFSFGTQWTQDKTVARDSRREERPRREGSPDRRDDRGPGAGAPDRRDRRAFRKPDGTAPADTGAPAPAGGGDNRPPRRDYAGGGGDNRGPRRDGPGEYRGGPRRDGPGGGGDRYAPRGGMQEQRGPYESPYFTSTFYPEDVSFATLAKTIRASCRTFELFDIARTVIGKPDRFVVVLQRRAAGEGGPATAEVAKPAPLAISVPDGIPFESEDAAIAHVVGKHLGLYFDTAEAEIEPPKGNFQVVNRCGVTGELLGPPNYHRYAQIIQQHHAAKVARMSFDSFRAKIETVRDPEVIAQWVEKMKKTTRYTWKTPGAPVAKVSPPAAPAAAEAAAETPAPVVAPETATGDAMPPSPSDADQGVAAPSAEAPAPAATAPADATAAPAAPAPLTFDSLEEARSHLLANARDKVVRAVEHARFHGKIIETIPPGEIRRAVEGTLERQHRFPLDTANALRGRLRREGFTIFKKGSKGISYVCAVKRKFRVPGQVFAETIGNLISFIEAHPMIKASELPAKFLGLTPVAPTLAGGGATSPSRPGDPEVAAPVVTPAAPTPLLTPEQRTQLGRMQGDLAWLVHEGYVTEFIDGRLFAAPPMVEARKKEIESSENDPENFPEAPASAPPFEAAPAAAPVATAGDATPPSHSDGDREVAAPSAVASAPAADESTPPAAV